MSMPSRRLRKVFFLGMNVLLQVASARVGTLVFPSSPPEVLLVREPDVLGSRAIGSGLEREASRHRLRDWKIEPPYGPSASPSPPVTPRWDRLGNSGDKAPGIR